RDADSGSAKNGARTPSSASSFPGRLNWEPIPRRDPAQTAPLSFQQQRVWFLNQLEPENPLYNQITALRLKGPLDEGALQESLDEIVRRHEVLRTVFPEENGTPVQRILAPLSPFPLQHVEIDARSKREAEEQLQKIALEQNRQPFDLLTQAP